ncbi:hypothetical protein INR49_000430 [Caranx melampygus]|nr:hypothetical protein INR49_000430 [Caranx melampygus]
MDLEDPLLSSVSNEKKQDFVLGDLEHTVAGDTATEVEATRDTGVKTSRCDTLKETQMCVTIALATLLDKSGVADIWKTQDLVTYTERLVKLTLQGLSVGPDYKPDSKDTHKICKTVFMT